jgi:hypothetical protein
MKRKIKHIKAMLLAKQLMDKQQDFIVREGLDTLSSDTDVTRFVSEHRKPLLRDKHGFIDWESLEEGGDV